MNKELTPLEALENVKSGLRTGIDECDEDLDIIETALERLEIIKEENQLLRENFVNLDDTYFETWYACERLKENSNYALMFVDDIYCLVDTKDNKFEVIDNYKVNSKGIIDNGTKKKLKAFEIIIDKNVDLKTLKEAFIFNGNNKEQCEMYNLNQWQWVFDLAHQGCVNTNRDRLPQLTQEEYDLLKEILS